MLERAFFTIYDVTAVVGVEVAGVAQHFEEAAHALFCFFLGLFLHVDGFVRHIQVSKHSVHQFKQLQGCLVVELHHAQMAHERRTVQSVNDELDLRCVEVWRLVEDFRTALVLNTVCLAFCCAHKSQLNSKEWSRDTVGRSRHTSAATAKDSND